MKTMILIVVAIAALLAGCTDAQKANIGSLGTPGAVKCYSGGKIIYEGKSTGKIEKVSRSDGWQFKDANTGKFVRVSGDCLIEN